jgi:Class III cytochrome C family
MRLQTQMMCLAGAVFLLVGVALAGQDVPETIQFKGAPHGGATKELFPEAYSGSISFQHAKHVDKYGANCGGCHHDGDHEPIKKFDPDESYNCADCHDQPGLVRGPIALNKIDESDLIAHRANALHKLCVGCHQEYNNKKHVVLAPEACRGCHAKRPRDWVLK